MKAETTPAAFDQLLLVQQGLRPNQGIPSGTAAAYLLTSIIDRSLSIEFNLFGGRLVIFAHQIMRFLGPELDGNFMYLYLTN